MILFIALGQEPQLLTEEQVAQCPDAVISEQYLDNSECAQTIALVRVQVDAGPLTVPSA